MVGNTVLGRRGSRTVLGAPDEWGFAYFEDRVTNRRRGNLLEFVDLSRPDPEAVHREVLATPIVLTDHITNQLLRGVVEELLERMTTHVPLAGSPSWARTSSRPSQDEFVLCPRDPNEEL